MALDVNPERSAASIAVADRDGTIEHRDGVGWVVERAVELAKKWNMKAALDPRGPAGLFAADLEAEYIEVVPYSPQEMTYACAAFFDAVMDGKAAVRPHAALDAAAAAATRRQVGDAWAWGRRGTAVDVSPIVAATMAHDLARRRTVDDDVWLMVE